MPLDDGAKVRPENIEVQHLWTRRLQPQRFTLDTNDNLNVYVASTDGVRHVHVLIASIVSVHHYRQRIDQAQPSWEERRRDPRFIDSQWLPVEDTELTARLSMICGALRGIIRKEKNNAQNS